MLDKSAAGVLIPIGCLDWQVIMNGMRGSGD